MYSNRKYSNGMWKDESKQQGKKSNETFLIMQSMLESYFKGMSVNFNQLTGECSYTFQFSTHEYIMTLNRKGTIIQESISSK